MRVLLTTATLFFSSIFPLGGQTGISCGETVSGEIMSESETDRFTFEANAGEAVQVAAVSERGDLDARVRLLAPSGQEIAQSDIDGDTGSIMLQVAGVYTIEIFDAFQNDTGTYSLNLQFTTGRCAVPLGCGQSELGDLGTRADQDAFSFLVNAAQSVDISALAGLPGLDAQAQLFDPSGKFLTQGPINGSISDLALADTGLYTILILDSFRSDTGNYQISLDFEGGCTAVAKADLSLRKADSPNRIEVGTLLTFTAIATNVRAKDGLPASLEFDSFTDGGELCQHTQGTAGCELASLEAGASTAVRFNVIPMPAGEIVKSARVTADQADPVSTNNSASQITTAVEGGIAPADLQVEVTASATAVEVGNPLSLSFKVANNGPGAATGVVLDIALPDAVESVTANAAQGGCQVTFPAVHCSLIDLEQGRSATVDVEAIPNAKGTLLFVANKTGAELDPDPGNNSREALAQSFADGFLETIADRVQANRKSFYVYKNADSGFNHGFASGFFGAIEKLEVDAACLDDPEAPNGCSNDTERLDQQQGNIFRVSFASFGPGGFAGLNFEEPENFGVTRQGMGYDLRPADRVVLEARSPQGVRLQFGVGESTTPFMEIPASEEFSEIVIPLNSLAPPLLSLQDIHVLFTVVTNAENAPDGGTVLLDNIRFEPVPAQHAAMPSFPLGTQAFGVVPADDVIDGRVPIPPDQVSRNLTTIFESSLALLALLDRGTQSDLELASSLAEAFHHAVSHDNSGLTLPMAPDGSTGLHNGYSGGDLPLFNDQGSNAGRKGEVRLAGFTAEDLCPPNGFCLVLDGATGGNVSFAILALLAAYREFEDPDYLEDARTLSHWIVQLLRDEDPASFGGYFLGYPDMGVTPKTLIRGKSTENNADIYAALSELAAIERELGNKEEADHWTEMANWGGDFVIRLFDAEAGRFYVGTVLAGTAPGPGIEPDGPQMGADLVNTADLLDENTFTTLAMAASPRYRHQIDWRRPVQYSLENFRLAVTAGGVEFEGFNIVLEPTKGPRGIAWEFTSQMVVTMRFVDQLQGEARFQNEIDFFLEQIGAAQRAAPFGDGQGLVAAVLQDGDLLPPREHCLSTPFQCIPTRVGLAATSWGAFARRGFNPLSPAFPTTAPDELFFAQFGDGEGQLFSKIVLFNLDGRNEASVRVILRDDDGNPLAVDLNGSEVENGERQAVIPPGGLRTFQTDGLGLLSTGSVRVNSDRPIAGLVLFGGNVGLAGVGSSASLVQGLAAPVQTDLQQTLNTGLALMNLESSETSVELQLLNDEGDQASSAILDPPLPPLGHRALFVNQFDWDPAVDFTNFQGRLQAIPSGRLAAIVIRTQQREFVTLPVSPLLPPVTAAGPSAGETLYFAQFADGAGLRSELVFLNRDDMMDAKAEIFLRDEEGLPLPVDLNGEPVKGAAQLVIPPSGRRGLATDGQGEVKTGSVEVLADRPISGVIIFEGSGGVAGVGSSPAFLDGFTAPIETDDVTGINTGVAVMNLTTGPSQLHFELLDPDGNPLGSAREPLTALGHRALFVTELDWSPELDLAQFQGLLRVRADTGISATVIQTRPSQLATMPAVPILAQSGIDFLPVADAGPDQDVDVGAVVNLDGSGSSDPEGSSLTFAWSFLDTPPGSSAQLSDPSAPMPSFTADLDGTFRIQLVVSDGSRESFPDVVTETAATEQTNSPPVADAGPDQTVGRGTLVVLDGNGSHDPDPDPLAFQWTFLERPPGSAAELSGSQTADPTFVADLAGSYVLQLVVNDGNLASPPDMVAITATSTPSPTVEQLTGIWDLNVGASNQEFLDAGGGVHIVEGALLIDSNTISLGLRGDDDDAGFTAFPYTLQDLMGDPFLASLSQGGQRLSFFDPETGELAAWDKRSGNLPPLPGQGPLTLQNLQGTWEINTAETSAGLLTVALGALAGERIVEGTLTFSGSQLTARGQTESGSDVSATASFQIVLGKILIIEFDIGDFIQARAAITNSGARLIAGLPEVGEFIEVYDRQ